MEDTYKPSDKKNEAKCEYPIVREKKGVQRRPRRRHIVTRRRGETIRGVSGSRSVLEREVASVAWKLLL